MYQLSTVHRLGVTLRFKKMRETSRPLRNSAPLAHSLDLSGSTLLTSNATNPLTRRPQGPVVGTVHKQRPGNSHRVRVTGTAAGPWTKSKCACGERVSESKRVKPNMDSRVQRPTRFSSISFESEDLTVSTFSPPSYINSESIRMNILSIITKVS